MRRYSKRYTTVKMFGELIRFNFDVLVIINWIFISPMEISEDTIAHARKMQNAEVKAYTFGAHPEQLRASRLVRVGIFQHQTPMATNVPIEQMRATMHKMAHDAITTAFYGHANIFCFQETWSKATNMN